jgi:hypothetical protein
MSASRNNYSHHSCTASASAGPSPAPLPSAPPSGGGFGFICTESAYPLPQLPRRISCHPQVPGIVFGTGFGCGWQYIILHRAVVPSYGRQCRGGVKVVAAAALETKRVAGWRWSGRHGQAVTMSLSGSTTTLASLQSFPRRSCVFPIPCQESILSR